MQIKFIGATNDVTGSMTLIETSKGKILIDSGLYQGVERIVRQNLLALPFDPREVDAIILTHAHLDHSGFIPRLVKLGFRGQIFCTKPTVKLAHLIMADSAEILAKKADHFMEEFYLPEHVVQTTSLFKPKLFKTPFDLLGLTITFLPAGHILGAASVKIQCENETIVFSGDLGRSDDPIIPAPEACPPADTVIMESTYGDRVRHGDIQRELTSFLKKIKSESKVGIIASFAVARGQLLITLIHQYFLANPEEKIRVVIDGPMMAEANKIYRQFSNETKIPQELLYALEDIEVIDHISEWDSIQKKSGPLVIISSSGMVTGGRIWRYLQNWQDDESAVLFLPGYQAEGTAGRALREGERVVQDEQGKRIRWRGEVLFSDAFSSHADQNELIAWTKNLSKTTKIILNHGELNSKKSLKKKFEDLGFSNCQIAQAEN